MAKTYTQSVTENEIVFTDDKGGTEKMPLVVPMESNEIISTLSKEIQGRGDVTRGCLTAILQVMDSPRMGTYSGKVGMGEKIPKELKSAISEQEVIYFQPLFYAYWDAKNKAPDAMDMPKTMAHTARRSNAWDKFIGDQRNGGIYGNCKTYATQYLAYFGKLPCVYDGDTPQKDRLLPVSAMAKAIAIAKAALANPNNLTGIARILKEALDALNKSTLTDTEIKVAEPMAREIASILHALKLGMDEKATQAAMQLPPNASPLQAGDIPQALEKVITNAKGKGKRQPKAEAKDKAPAEALM